jgi:hypothetical protein
MASHGMNCDIVYLTTVCGALEACQAILEGGGGHFDAKRIQLHHLWYLALSLLVSVVSGFPMSVVS